MTFILETNRLILREFSEDDAAAMFAIYSGQNVMQYLTRRPFLSIVEVRGHLQSIINDYSTHGYGFWAVTDKITGQIVGRCGLLSQSVDGQNETEIAYLLGRDKWSLGYATEAAHACISYGHKQFDLERVIALIHPLNTASINVALKIGLHYEKQVQFHGHERCCYAKSL